MHNLPSVFPGDWDLVYRSKVICDVTMCTFAIHDVALRYRMWRHIPISFVILATQWLGQIWRQFARIWKGKKGFFHFPALLKLWNILYRYPTARNKRKKFSCHMLFKVLNLPKSAKKYQNNSTKRKTFAAQLLVDVRWIYTSYSSVWSFNNYCHIRKIWHVIALAVLFNSFLRVHVVKFRNKNVSFQVS